MSWQRWVREIEIEPSLYAADFLRLGEQIDHLIGAGARVFHFDIGDGHFVEPVTIGPIVIQSIAPLVHRFEGVIDCHLMVDNPEHHFEMVKNAGGDSVTFHVEACEEPWKAIKLARDLGLGVGVAFNPETSVSDAVGASIGADLVLCMSIHPGYSGQEFMPESLGAHRRAPGASSTRTSSCRWTEASVSRTSPTSGAPARRPRSRVARSSAGRTTRGLTGSS